MAQSKDFTISDLSGGYNDSDPPTSLQANQCVTAENVDFFKAPCGARRLGCVPIAVSANMQAAEIIPLIYKHIPASAASNVQLWGVWATPGVSIGLSYKTTAWADVTLPNIPTNTGVYPYQFAMQSLHGKLFIAYRSNVNRLHVFDGTDLRMTGLTEVSMAPVAGDTGSGTYASARYFRTRETAQVSSVTILRSEPSPTLTFTPSGSGSGANISKPTTENSNATHWELEASVNNADFYRIATSLISVGSVIDSVAFGTGYATTGTLSEDIGDYTVIPSGRYLLADEDRLLIGGSFEDETAASVVRWTPVNAAPGVGNDERIPIDTDNALDLDGSEGGGLTALVGPIFGAIFAFKQGRIYKLTRTGAASAAYTATIISRTRGAVSGSAIEAVDEAGRPALYFLDPKVGPVRFGDGGFPNYQVMLNAGQDILTTWDSVNLDATTVVSRAVFYPEKQQIHWFLATGNSDTPTLRITLQIDSTRTDKTGVKLGWAKHTGVTAQALSTCLYPTNIEDSGPRSIAEKPLISVGNQILMLDTGNDDNGADYIPLIVSKPYLLAGTINNKFGIRAGSVIGAADNEAIVKIILIRDFGVEQSPIVNLSMAPEGLEDPVIKIADSLRISESRVIQVQLTDGEANNGQWSIHRIDLTPRAEETD